MKTSIRSRAFLTLLVFGAFLGGSAHAAGRKPDRQPDPTWWKSLVPKD